MSDDLAERIRRSIDAAFLDRSQQLSLRGAERSAVSPMESSIPITQDRAELILSLYAEHENASRILREINELPDNEMWPVSVKATASWTAQFFITKAMVRQQVLDQLTGLAASIQKLNREVANGG